ncbi:unnamed protein product [Parnassius apollo]|uniref:(apollo) hypothetical protein n=1 Tax=Parnassius apollo TaxID=110799 RepID=A0A8S3WKK6_PARAO|nr:unnamed protein product [Parnassius apollo]
MEPNTKQNILAGFIKAGISPLNKDKVLNRLPGNNLRHEFCLEEKEAIDESVLSLLKEMRYGPENTRTIRKPKKINVIPGKSVEDSDYVESDISSSNALSDVDSQVAKSEVLQEKQILEEQQQQNFNIDLIDIDNTPVLLLDDNFTVTENNCIVTEEHSALLEDNLTVTEDNFIATEDQRQKDTQPKIRILSDVIYKGNMKKPIELKPSANRLKKSNYYENNLEPSLKPKPSICGLRRPRYYKDDMEILRDLMDSDDE